MKPASQCLFMLQALFRTKSRFAVRVNTHRWAWFIPEGDSVELPATDQEITDAFWLSGIGIEKAFAILRRNFPQASFTAASWQGENAWNTRTFELKDADTEEGKAFLAALEQAHQEILLSAQSAYNRLHPEG